MCLDVGEVRDSESVWCRDDELTINEVVGSSMVLIGDCRDSELATATNASNALLFHEPAHRSAGNSDAFTLELHPDLLSAVVTVETGLLQAVDLGSKYFVTLCASARRASHHFVVGAGSELQSSAGRLDSQSSLDVSNYLIV
jgi:hypothetical protein